MFSLQLLEILRYVQVAYYLNNSTSAHQFGTENEAKVIIRHVCLLLSILMLVTAFIDTAFLIFFYLLIYVMTYYLKTPFLHGLHLSYIVVIHLCDGREYDIVI